MSALVIEDAGETRILRLNRPQAMNAFNVALLTELLDALRGATGCGAVVIEGEGRAFCVGEDLKETLAPRTGGAEELREALELLQEITRAMTRCPAPIVCALHGFAIGGGAELPLAADIVIAHPATRFRFPEVALGHAPTGGANLRLPAVVGLLKAKELLLTARWVEADEALRIGLVNELADDPHARAREQAATLAGYPRRSVASTKRGLELAVAGDQEAVLAAEVDAASYCFAAAEAKQSMEDFRAGKRQ
jgi:2-(1,2-epoxy-1,2-dihydrophenyl)acetyl-CoA isomerase